jgi:tetratricopeptide (TPR) repeat protein
LVCKTKIELKQNRIKMKLERLLLGTLILIGFASYAQDSDEDRECTRMRFLAGEELKIKNYAGASMYYLKGEKICGGYDAANYGRLIGSLRNAINGVTDPAAKTAYTDTLVEVYQRAEDAGVYDQADDLLRGSYILQASSPNRKKADSLFQRGIKTQGVKTNEAYVSYFYYNTYAMYAAAPSDVELKKRMISDYFELSALVSKAGMSVKTQETITEYFNAVVRSCDDILPELKGYMENLPTDPEMKKATVMNFLNLLENKSCTESPEYFKLIDIYVEIDPTSFDAQMMKAKALIGQNKYSDAISTLRKAKELAPDNDKAQEINYEIARAQYASGSYTAAYNTAMSISGAMKGKALVIAGQCVGKNANNCGSTTMERKSNYVYAVQLLEQARSLGESTGGTISSYKAMYPTDQEKFENGNPSTMTLSCYGVTVNI